MNDTIKGNTFLFLWHLKPWTCAHVWFKPSKKSRQPDDLAANIRAFLNPFTFAKLMWGSLLNVFFSQTKWWSSNCSPNFCSNPDLIIPALSEAAHSGNYPISLKVAQVSHTLKSGFKFDYTNYRHIFFSCLEQSIFKMPTRKTHFCSWVRKHLLNLIWIPRNYVNLWG